jgi:ATP-dependent DNA helicase RecQ
LRAIGREVGIEPEAIAQAARSVEMQRGAGSGPRTFLGLPIGVSRTVHPSRRVALRTAAPRAARADGGGASAAVRDAARRGSASIGAGFVLLGVGGVVAIATAIAGTLGQARSWRGKWEECLFSQVRNSPSVTATSRPSAQGELEKWRAVRAIVLERDSHVCRDCGEKCSKGEADVHHLIPRAAGGDDDPANLITLCDGCHAAHHPNLQGSLARRMIERWGLKLARALDFRHELVGVDESLGAVMRLLGVTHLRTPQLDVILAALRGESLLLVSATGSGKSLCFQVPILLKPGCGFVISPLKALMNQQVEHLQRKKIPGTFINGDLGPQEKKIRYQLLQDGAIKFLYCTPERFDRGMVRQAELNEIVRARPSYLVVDEAHCIDRWGRDFRQNYGKLGAIREVLGSPPVLAFTASAGMQSQRRILESLGVPDARVVVTGVNRPNIKFLRVPNMTHRERFSLIENLLRVMPPGRAMLFVPTVNTGEELQEGLRSLGMEVPFFHSKFGTANERDMLLGQFTGRINPPVRVIICTNAFGMGLDLPDVRLVVHWQHPASPEDYLQEFGRAGRDGKSSVAVVFTGANDEGLLRFMAEKTSEMAADNATRASVLDAKLEAINEMRRIATSRGVCVREDIVRYFGETPSVRRRSIAVRIAEWVLSRSIGLRRTRFCCDQCDHVDVDNVIDWAGGVFAQAR